MNSRPVHLFWVLYSFKNKHRYGLAIVLPLKNVSGSSSAGANKDTMCIVKQCNSKVFIPYHLPYHNDNDAIKTVETLFFNEFYKISRMLSTAGVAAYALI